MITLRRIMVSTVWFVGLALAGACTTTTDTNEMSLGSCTGDADCQLGRECVGGGCVTVRPTLYDHIQLASALFRSYNSDAEKYWRATHADLLIGQTIVASAELRAANPNVRLVPYFANRYHHLDDEAVEWCSRNGGDPEDFYLHYREDVYLPDYPIVLVPGYPAAFVPGWNPNPQPGDGPASAASREESRAFGFYNPAHEPWYLANLENPNYRDFARDYIRTLIDGTVWGPNGDPEPADAIVMDHGVYYPEWNEGSVDKTIEFFGVPLDDNHPYGVAFESFYPNLEQYLGAVFRKGIDVIPNYGNASFFTRPDRFSQGIQEAVDWGWGEVWLNHRPGDTPTDGSLRVVSYDRDYERGIAAMTRQSRAGKRRIIGARDLTNGTDGTDRGRLFLLALYYLVANPNTFFEFETATTHQYGADVSTWQWNPAVQYNIGQPASVPPGFTDFDGRTGTREHFVFIEGNDPYNPSLTFRILARRFTNALVLVKMLPVGSVTDDRSITVIDVGKTYGLLGGDGTITSYTQQVILRNNEAAILIDS